MAVPLQARAAFLPAFGGQGSGAYDGNLGGLPRSLPTRLGGSGFFSFFRAPRRSTGFVISGVSRDSVGAVLVSCVVDLFQIFDPTGASEPPARWVARTISDAATGAYSFSVPSDE